MEDTAIKCSEKGCEFVASHAKPAVANRMIGLHKRHTHGILGKAAKAATQKKRKVGRPASNGHSNRVMVVRSDIPIRSVEDVINPSYKPAQEHVTEADLDTAVDNMERAMLGMLLEKFPCCPCCGNNNGRYLTQILAEIKHELSTR